MSRDTDLADYPLADDVRAGVLVYSADAVAEADRRAAAGRTHPRAHRRSRRRGVRGRLRPTTWWTAASAAFTELIDAQRAEGAAAGDHFGKAGANDRIWNAAQKLALHAPEVFAEYYANDTLALVSQAWLGPRYQVTSQVNVVNPGGAAQVPHRDYHLGFVNADQLSAYPAHLHRMSAALTLQGAVAHCDMPLESGPTMLLPYSQRFAAGYVAFYRPEFIEYFAEHHVQMPLRKGDAVFFNPALYHGAGANTSDRHPADGQPAAGVVAVRAGDGVAGPHRDGARDLPGPAGDAGRGPAGARARQRGGRHRRGLRVPHQPRPRPTHRQPGPAKPGRPRAGRTGRRTRPQKHSTPHCAAKKNGESHDHTRRNRTRPHRRVPHRNPQRPAGTRRPGDHRRAPDVAEAVAAKHGATPVDSVEALLSSGVDGVVVAAATPAHAALTLAAVERGMPTFCEKPVAVHRRGERPRRRGHRALRRAGAGRLPAPVRRRVRGRQAAVDSGSLGTLHTVRSTTMDPAPPPMDYIKGSGGIFRDCAVHDFDVLRWITGQNAVEVYATGSVQGDPLFAEYGDVDTAAVVVTIRRRRPGRGVRGALQRPRL